MLYYADQAPLQDSDSEDEFDDEESDSDSEEGKLWHFKSLRTYDKCNIFFKIGLTMADIIMGQMMFGGGRMPMSPPGRGRHGCYC